MTDRMTKAKMWARGCCGSSWQDWRVVLSCLFCTAPTETTQTTSNYVTAGSSLEAVPILALNARVRHVCADTQTVRVKKAAVSVRTAPPTGTTRCSSAPTARPVLQAPGSAC